jgi:DNA mismatch endonuclease (patch repair protein)
MATPIRATSSAPATPAPDTSTRMRAVRQRDTAPELQARRILHRLGARFRVCPPDLPGRPDIANKSRKWCVFVHGCFWHGHSACMLARLPRTNNRWWTEKISANKRRDARKEAAMRELGFRVAVVWQCELFDEASVARRLRSLLALTRKRPRRRRRAGSNAAP